MSNNINDIWQICILTDTNQSILVTISKNASVADLFKKFRTEHSGFKKQSRLTFLVVDGVELQENDRRRLVDVDCLRNKCNIRLIVHVDGGVWPTEIEIQTQIRNPNNIPSLAGRITNDVPDVMGLDDEIPRVKMSCGHAVGNSCMKMSSDQNNMWQIYILTDIQENIVVTINKNESVASLFKKFRAKRKVFLEERRLSFLDSDGSELQENDQRRLVDVGCLRDKCNIRLIVHAAGGGWPTDIEIEQEIRDPTKVPSLAGRITEDHPDIMGLDDETPRVIMSCGHAIAPSSLALHCYHELQKGVHTIRCPDRDCDEAWSFASIIDAACLSLNETTEFERTMISNRLMHQAKVIRECPGCGNSYRRSNENDQLIHCRKCTSDKARNFDFCWICLKEWVCTGRTKLCGNSECGDSNSLFTTLATCDVTKVIGIECPSRRACPNCLMLIEHVEYCKSMICRNANCKYKFCFLCLQRYPCATGPYNPCELAPRQQPTSVPPPPPPNNGGCTIS